MICELCGKREALVFIEQNSADRKAELHLCAECARSRGLSTSREEISESLSRLMDAVGGPGASSAWTFSPSPDNASEKRCPLCDATLSELKRRRMAGCHQCWSTFGSGLLPSELGGGGGSGRRPGYRGRLPHTLESSRRNSDSIIALEAELSRALAAEDYELAARSRDRIRALGGEVPL